MILFLTHNWINPFFGMYNNSAAMSNYDKRQLKKMDYYATLATIAWSTGEFDSVGTIPHAVADFAVTDLVCKSLYRCTGIKKKKWALPFLPFIVLSGKGLIKHAITACKSGYACKDELKERYGNKKWLYYFLTGLCVPYAVRSTVTSKVFNAVDQKTGLSEAPYPKFVLNSTALTVLAWQMHSAVIDWCSNTIQSVYDMIVPETRVEKYLRIKQGLKAMAASD